MKYEIVEEGFILEDYNIVEYDYASEGIIDSIKENIKKIQDNYRDAKAKDNFGIYYYDNKDTKHTKATKLLNLQINLVNTALPQIEIIYESKNKRELIDRINKFVPMADKCKKVDEALVKELRKLKKDTILNFKRYRGIAINNYNEINRVIKNIELIFKEDSRKNFVIKDIQEFDADMNHKYRQFVITLTEFYSAVNRVLNIYYSVIYENIEEKKTINN